MGYDTIQPPQGHFITLTADQTLVVPEQPVIPYIMGDGVGLDVTPVMIKTVNAAVQKAYGVKRQIEWLEVFAGEKAVERYGDARYALPDETLKVLAASAVAIKGPLSRGDGLAAMSINAKIRQALGLAVCWHPIGYFPAMPTPLKNPVGLDLSVFRQNAEVNNARISWQASREQAQAFIHYLNTELNQAPQLEGETVFNLQTITKNSAQALLKQAIEYAIHHNKSYMTLVHRANSLPITESIFCDWGVALAQADYQAEPCDEGWIIKHPLTGLPILLRAMTVETFLQQILMGTSTHSVVVPSRDGDSVSDVLGALVGGLGLVPTIHLNGRKALFEPTHGTALKYTGQDKVNPSAMILAAACLLRHIGWIEAADLILKGLQGAILAKTVTYDFARQMEGATQLACSEFGDAIIQHLSA